MKKLFSIFTTIILLSSSFGVASAQELESSGFKKLVENGNREILFQQGAIMGGFTVNEWESPEEAEKRFFEERNKALNVNMKKQNPPCKQET